MDLHSLIDALGPGLPGGWLGEFASEWTSRLAKKGEILARQGEQVTQEVVVLDGKMVCQIADSDGRGVCVGSYTGPGFVTPHIARTRCDKVHDMHQSISLHFAGYPERPLWALS